MLTLIDTKTGNRITKGQTVTDFRGEAATVTGWQEPLHSASKGRIHVEDAGGASAYFPSVYGCRFVELETDDAGETGYRETAIVKGDDGTRAETTWKPVADAAGEPGEEGDRARRAKALRAAITEHPAEQGDDLAAIAEGAIALRRLATTARGRADHIDEIALIRTTPPRTASDRERSKAAAARHRERADQLEAAAAILEGSAK